MCLCVCRYIGVVDKEDDRCCPLLSRNTVGASANGVGKPQFICFSLWPKVLNMYGRNFKNLYSITTGCLLNVYVCVCRHIRVRVFV